MPSQNDPSTLYVFGDSFATPDFCVEPRQSFWGRAAQDLQVDEIHNHAHDGMPLDVILHVVLNETIDWSHSYILVGIPPLPRIGIFKDQSRAMRRTFRVYDRDFNQTNQTQHSVTNVHWLDTDERFRGDRFTIAHYDHGWQELQSLEKILLLHAYLSQRTPNFIIANLTAPIAYQPDWEIGKKVYEQIKDLRECILFEDTPHDFNQRDGIKPVDRPPGSEDCWFGHHGAEGNANWYHKVLKPRMKSLGWFDE
jgi:hypothetical protein